MNAEKKEGERENETKQIDVASLPLHISLNPDQNEEKKKGRALPWPEGKETHHTIPRTLTKTQPAASAP